MPRKQVIGIHGPARSGKDSAAAFLLAARGGYKYSFADPIRAMLLPLGIDMRDMFWQERKEEVIPALGVSPRFLMQTLGTEWGRNVVNSDIWLILAKQKLLQAGAGMVLADVRFENEATWVRQQGGVVIHMLRNDAAKVREHVSEAGVVVHANDVVIANNGTLEELQTSMKAFVDEYET